MASIIPNNNCSTDSSLSGSSVYFWVIEPTECVVSPNFSCTCIYGLWEKLEALLPAQILNNTLMDRTYLQDQKCPIAYHWQSFYSLSLLQSIFAKNEEPVSWMLHTPVLQKQDDKILISLGAIQVFHHYTLILEDWRSCFCAVMHLITKHRN